MLFIFCLTSCAPESLSVIHSVVIKTALSAAGAAESGGGARGRTPARTPRRLPSNIYSHAPAAALTARGAPVQIWQPWEVPTLPCPPLPCPCPAVPACLPACACLCGRLTLIVCLCMPFHCQQHTDILSWMQAMQQNLLALQASKKAVCMINMKLPISCIQYHTVNDPSTSEMLRQTLCLPCYDPVRGHFRVLLPCICPFHIATSSLM